MDICYRPVILPNQGASNTFRCLPVDRKAAGGPLRGKAALRHHGDPRITAEMNAALIVKAFADLFLANAKGHRFRLIVPVNSYSMATSEACSVMVHAVKELDPELRKAAVIEIYEFPKSMTLDSLDDITVPLLLFFDNFLAEPEPGTTDFTIFSNCNYFGVSLDIEGRGLDGETASAQLADFSAQATNRRLKLVVQGIADKEVADNARRYEAFAMDGPLLGSDTDTLEPPQPVADTG